MRDEGLNTYKCSKNNDNNEMCKYAEFNLEQGEVEKHCNV